MMTRAPTRESQLVEEFRDRLAWARLRLARTVATSDDDLEAIAAHECREIAEEPEMGTVGGLLARLQGPAREELAEIEAAQARLEGGAFGRCEDCRRPIPLARLRATPTLRACGGCREEPAAARWPKIAGVVIAVSALLLGACAARGQGDGITTRGQTAFMNNGCYGCHIVGKVGTPIGPELSHVGLKYSPEYLARWLHDPAVQRPSAHMPALELSDDDIRALAAYLASLR
ncbi:MAG TPA: c-type cytochrome [Candidatus Binatia bacterium]|nr:c-type cytochrome [Candidatus Binatia bacterium]